LQGPRKDAAYTPAVRRRSGQLARLLALALCALVAVACGAKPEPTSGKLDTTYPASVRDGTNTIITVEAPPRLVLVVEGGPQRLLSRLGVRAAVAPADVTAARIEAAHPDLVVVGPNLTSNDDQHTADLRRRLAVPVYVMPGGRLQDVERGAVALGVLTNHAEAGRALALSLRRQRENITQRLARSAPVTVYVDAGFGASIQRTTLLAHLLGLAGARLVGPTDGFTTVNARKLQKLDPDAYVATSTSGVTLATLRTKPGMRKLRSVAAGRVFVVDAAAARADTTAYGLLQSIAHSLHPAVVEQ
jgi:ABC-type Fe3+-hydroxamate transport system substrate-binding protein